MERYFAQSTGESSQKRARIDNNITTNEEIVSDPARLKSINEYDPGIRDNMRRKYVQMGPCRPISHCCPQSLCRDRLRSFQIGWFNKYEWLEYSVSEDVAFCFWCYLFGEKRAGDQVFTGKGFRKWKKAPEKF